MSSLSQLAATPEQPQAASASAKDVDLATFMADVIEASRSILVLAHFWVPRAAPCQQLEASLEKVVGAYKGGVSIARVDVEKNPEIAQQMGIQSIPAIFAFYQGRPLDGVQGLLSEAQLKDWLEKLIKASGVSVAANVNSSDEALKHAADYLASGDLETAHAVYADILDAEPNNAQAYAGLLRCLIAEGKSDEAKEMLAKAPADVAKNKVLDPIRTSLELAEQSGNAAPVAELQAKLAQNEADHQTRYDLAMAHYAAGEKEEAVDQLLEIVRRQRKWNEEAARKQLVKFFEAFGPMDPVTIAARKRLSSILFS
ncbi:MAG TPA: tetratricopeptide repeat protein [Alphaproteobacteria bacterium]|nr:tetratricopeptide repeat protein [Alphaproteobacteria bacterium]